MNLDCERLSSAQTDLERLAEYDKSGVDLAPKVVHLVARLVSILHWLERVHVLVARDQLRALGNARGRLELVAGEHPDLDACVAQRLQCGAHVRLQLVLDARQTQQLQVFLETLDHHLNLLVSILHT